MPVRQPIHVDPRRWQRGWDGGAVPGSIAILRLLLPGASHLIQIGGTLSVENQLIFAGGGFMHDIVQQYHMERP